MKLKHTLILCGLSLLIWKGLPAAQAQVEFVTNDLDTEGSWQDNFVDKTDDIDEDSTYGTKGYILPAGKRKGRARDPWLKDSVITASKDSLNKLPAYIKSLEFADPSERGSSYGGEENDSDYGTLDFVQADFPSHKGLTGAPIMLNGADALTKNLAIYFRNTFQYDGEKNVKLRVLADDGFVAYINGVEVARRNAPAAPLWNSTASRENPDEDVLSFEGVDLSDRIGLLAPGLNVLAFHGLNIAAADEDFLLYPELVGFQFSDQLESYLSESYTVSREELTRLLQRIRHTRAANHGTPWPVEPDRVNKCFLHLPTLFDQDRSQRIWNLLTKGEEIADLVEHPEVLGIVRQVLGLSLIHI